MSQVHFLILFIWYKFSCSYMYPKIPKCKDNNFIETGNHTHSKLKVAGSKRPTDTM